ncbi:MAG TPA: class I SAM-dependent methyltransferase [Thermoanaerobaculia bacterium]|nr:class I SAM-dependent methyltransferase [Thermoanaerobaculia bacterium]
MTVPYRDFYYPLNVFMHVLTLEEGSVEHLHYGLFERDDEPISTAQERSTALLLSRLPPPPARILEAGIGLGTTLARLTRLGYNATGCTPDEQQIAMARARHPEIRVAGAKFEEMTGAYDAIVFQESSQYIESEVLFAKAAELAPHVVVLDEFALKEEGVLHRLDEFLAAAAHHGFALTERVDLSKQAPPTIDYFTVRLPRYRDELMRDLGLTDEQMEELITNGVKYSDAYRQGVYAYLLLQFQLKSSP